MAIFAGCEQYDDSTLTGRVDDLENRVSELEQYIEDLNNTIQGVSSIVRALQDEERVVSVEPLADGTGYKIVFSDGSEATIKNGEEPSIGIRQDTDGIWYWTVDGEFLLDGSDKIPAINAPEFKIEGGQLFYKVNGGEWQEVPGAETGFGLVQDVKDDDDKVTLILSTGKSIDIPKVQSFSLNIESPYPGVMPKEQLYIPYSVTEGDDNTVVKALCDNGFTASVNGGSEEGVIIVSAPDEVPAQSTILVVAVNSKGQMSGKILSFENGTFTLVENTVTVGSQGGEVVLKIQTNMNYQEPQISPDCSGWISKAPETKALRTDELVYIVTPFENTATEQSRTGTITVSYGNASIETFTIVQLATEVADGGSADFDTFPSSQNRVKKLLNESTVAGWTISNAYMRNKDVVIPEAATKFPCLAGYTDKPGVLTSPVLEGGCGILSVDYATQYIASYVTTGLQFKVEVKNENSEVLFSETVTDTELEQHVTKSKKITVNKGGKFTITITNLCPMGKESGGSTNGNSYDDIHIPSVSWTGYEE